MEVIEDISVKKMGKPIRRGVYNQLSILFAVLPKKYKFSFAVLQLFSILAAAAEIISIGALYPFLLSITNPELVNEIKIISFLMYLLGVEGNGNLILILCILFAIAVIISGAVRIGVTYAQTKFAFDVGHVLSKMTFEKTINRSYGWHIRNNSSQAITVVTQKSAGVVANFFIPLLSANTSMIFLIFVLISGIILEPTAILGILIFVCVLYYLVVTYVGKRIARNGSVINKKMTQSVKIIMESLGSIRDIVLNNHQARFIDEFKNVDSDLKQAHASNSVLKIVPKLLVELVSLVVLALASLIALQFITADKFFATAGVAALCLQRILPNAQSLYHAYASFKNGSAALSDVMIFMDDGPNENKKRFPVELKFDKEIKLVDVWYRYDVKKPWVLKGVNISIKKGEKICLFGASGAGKSTLMDIILGLLKPERGEIYLDGVKLTQSNMDGWQRHVSHVPQDVFLFDSTIKENVTFGENSENLWGKAVHITELREFVDQLPDGFETRPGEAGIGLSGGQKQRIGLARSFFQDCGFYVIDEGTSALDKKTEGKVLQKIFSNLNDKTILFCTHSNEVLKHADRLLEVKNGNLHEMETESN